MQTLIVLQLFCLDGNIGDIDKNVDTLISCAIEGNAIRCDTILEDVSHYVDDTVGETEAIGADILNAEEMNKKIAIANKTDIFPEPCENVDQDARKSHTTSDTVVQLDSMLICATTVVHSDPSMSSQTPHPVKRSSLLDTLNNNNNVSTNREITQTVDCSFKVEHSSVKGESLNGYDCITI